MLRAFTDEKWKPSWNSILSAIRFGDLETVKSKLNDCDINGRYNSFLFLCGALKYRQKEVAKYLLSRGAKVNPREQLRTPDVPTTPPGYFMGRKEDIFHLEANPLHLAVRMGNEEIVELILKKGAWINQIAGPNASTPLCDAIQYNKPKMIEILLSHGANVNTPSCDGKTPLMIAAGKRDIYNTKLLLDHGADPSSGLASAAEGGKLEVVKLLLSKGADINVKSGHVNSTLLHIAAANRHGQLVDFLLKRRVDVNAVDAFNKSVLTTAVETSCPVIVSIVLSHCPDLKLEGNQNAMHSALRCQSKTDVPHERHVYAEIIQSLLSYGFTIDDKDAADTKSLFIAVRNGNTKIVAELIKRGSNRQMLRNSILSELLPLYPSTLWNTAKLTNVLIKYGADENARCTMGLEPVRRSLFRNIDYDMFKILITDTAAIKHDRDSLNFAVWHGYLEIVKCLLRHGADVNAQDSCNRAALHFCVLRPKNALCPILQRARSSIHVDKDIVKKLASCGADLNVRTKMGETPLHIAAQNNLTEIVEVLVELGADVNASDDRGLTALHYFVRNGNLKMSEYILSKGAQVNARGKEGETPLHVASERGRLDLVQSLLEYGAHINSSCMYGTALHKACGEGRSDVVKFLVEYGADINIMNQHNETPLAHVVRRGCTAGESQDFLRKFFCRHLIKMKAANMFISEKNLRYICGLAKDTPFHGVKTSTMLKECEDEVAALKGAKLENFNISCYDVLVASSARLVKLSLNERLREIVNACDFDEMYPNYASMIKRRYQKGRWMRELWERCNETLGCILPQLPYLCIERILAHVPIADMRMLAIAH